MAPPIDEFTLAFVDERDSDEAGPHDRDRHARALPANLRSGDVRITSLNDTAQSLGQDLDRQRHPIRAITFTVARAWKARKGFVSAGIRTLVARAPEARLTVRLAGGSVDR
jgi:hypothetical protein